MYMLLVVICCIGIWFIHFCYHENKRHPHSGHAEKDNKNKRYPLSGYTPNNDETKNPKPPKNCKSAVYYKNKEE